MSNEPNDPLKEINKLLEKIKDELNKTGDKGDKFILHIVDQENSPVRSRTEDIELKIRSLILSRK